ncbi:hypothetical protein LOD99_13602 [Oopsacas minuta]|uniref:NADPH-dependent FMN reductase-like domain-containing protein n=1 Tax=Oopsacas minuta TaxID=111878 RepID=A0AAV7KJ47_9METZ|nr:hypothetical protein LOD99_13602 [Oopsacas minuta]
MVFLGSGREGRMGERVSTLIRKKLESKEVNVSFIDPLTLGEPVVKQPIQFLKDPSLVADNLKKYNEEIIKSDAYFLITAEYNGSICPGLSNCIDYFPPSSYEHKPFAISSYSMGPFGGVIAGSSLRHVISVLGGFPIAGSLVIPEVHKAVSEDGVGNERVERNAEKIVNSLLWYTEAIKKQKETKPLPK